MIKVIIVGSGGHAKVVINILQECNDFKIIGITSNSLPKGTMFAGYVVLGNDEILNDYDRNEYVLAMGLGGFSDNKLRKKVFMSLKKMGFRFINVIHPSAIISRNVKFGEGVVLFPGVVLNTEVEIGNNSIIATGSTIDHETIIGNNVLISAGVTIGAYSKIKDDSLIALGAKIISGVVIGENSLVGAGAVVLKNVDDNVMVVGVPAIPKKHL